MKNHQPRLRVVAWVLLNSKIPVYQAPFPIPKLGLLIRIAGID